MRSVQTILHPTDFSDCSRYAFHLACRIAREEGARLIVLHVNPTGFARGGYPEVLEQLPAREYKEWLWKILRRFQVPDARATVEHQLTEGEPSRQILDVARQAGCDLIVMGTHGRTGLGRVILGSVTEEVLRRCPCPVVTVQMPTHPRPAVS